MMVRGLSTSFLSIRLFSRVHKKWHETKHKLFSETPSLRVILCRKGETVRCLLFVIKPREQIIERVLQWNTFTPAEGRTKAAKKHLSFCFFFEEKLLSFSFLSHVSLFILAPRCVFFKKSGRKSICWLFFFHSRNQERFPPQNHSQNDQLYISLYIHLRTTNTITTHIIHHSRRRANANASVCCCCCCCCFISLARAVVVWTQKSARVPFF